MLDFAHLAIKQLAFNRLQMAVENYFGHSFRQQIPSISSSYQAKERCQIAYGSNVAFIFSKFLNTSALEVAKLFATFYTQTELHQKDFAIAIVPPGVVQLQLTELKLASWLQCLPLLPLILANVPLPQHISPLKNNLVFAIQYAYARCYSLIQLAQKENLIVLTEISANQIKSMFPNLSTPSQEEGILIINHPQLLPWLNYRQQLQFCHQAEYALIIQLVKVVDELCCSPQLNLNEWAKTALNLSRAFADFHSHCQIFGQTNAQTPQLAQARLGLILATYVVLKLLLQVLGIFAPQEL